MKLEDILEPVSNSLLADASMRLPATLAKSILPIIPGLTDVADAKILLLGVYSDSTETGWSPDKVREALYSLYKPHGLKGMADLGNIAQHLSPTEMNGALEFIADYCARENKTLVVLSPDQNQTLPLFKGVRKHRNDVGISIIDNTIDIKNILVDIPSEQYLTSILEDTKAEPQFLSVIGIQNYLVNPQDVNLSGKMYVELMRLGELRADIKGAEPILRDANLVSFDMAAIRYSDNPDSITSSPNGLYAEESCTLARYAGFADKLDIFALFGDFIPTTTQNISAQLAAQLVWHFLDGYANRKQEYPLASTNKRQKFIVKLGKDDEELIFYKSKQTDRWWMEVFANKKKKLIHIISCRYEDYQEACRQEVPFRWLWYYKKWN